PVGADNTVRTWDLTTATEQRRVRLPSTITAAHLLGFTRALLHTKEGSICVWDMEREIEVVQVRRGKDSHPAARYNISRDGRWLSAAEYHGWVPRRNPGTPKL